ncbi:MAG: HAD-IIA family hydrolase [Firmicutes bacterium]|nr:HAD-IIA family hydrolase [Bacillota bacterium]
MDKTLKNIRQFLFDLDGTVFLGDKIIDGAKDVFEEIKRQNKNFAFVTNNSSKTAGEYFEKLKGMGIELEQSGIITSNMVAIDHLKENFCGKRVYLFATENVKKEYIKSGINVTEDYKNCDVSVLTYNTSANYKDLCNFVFSINNGSFYVATHIDINCPSILGNIPDIGSFIELIYTSTKKRPQKFFGKPEKVMGEFIQKLFNLSSDKIAMTGDRLYTDMEFALNSGFKSILVLSGETKKEMITKKYDLVIDSIKCLMEL